MNRLWELVQNVPWWVVWFASALGAVGLSFVNSATVGQDTAGQASKQALFLVAGVLGAVLVFVVPFVRIRRAAWSLYALSVLSLALLPWFGSVLNGARRWFIVFGFGLQPSEFAKCAVVLAVASWLRFRDADRFAVGVAVPLGIAALPVALIVLQPDLGSSLVFWPMVFAMCFAAGARARQLLAVAAAGAGALVLAWWTVLHDYQKTRVAVWLQHFTWDRAAVDGDPAVQSVLQGHGYQPWQSLIAIGSGGWTGFGYMRGPQNRYDFLPYRSGDYVFAVIAEEIGFVGAAGVVVLEMGLVLAILAVAARTRERFGRLVAVGVAAWIGTQSLFHVAVCAWLVPATGLPMPLVSHGGSSTLSVCLGLALVLSLGARRETVLAADGFR